MVPSFAEATASTVQWTESVFMQIKLAGDPQSRLKLPSTGTMKSSSIGRSGALVAKFVLTLIVSSKVCSVVDVACASLSEAKAELGEISATVNPSAEQNEEATPFESVSSTAKTTTLLRTLDDVKQFSRKRCSRYYTLDCLKLDVISFVDRLGRNTNFNVVYGISVISDTSKYLISQRMYGAKNMQYFSNDNGHKQLDEILLQKLKDYVNSLSLSVQLFDNQKNIGRSFAENLLDTVVGSFEGRASKKTGGTQLGGKYSGALTSAALVTVGALVWLGFSTMAAVAAKALVTALVSLMISCFTAYKNSGSHKSTTYEIVARPLYTHGHSVSAAELQHDPHSAAATTGAAGYGRNMEWDKSSNVPQAARLEDPVASAAVHDMVYKAHVRPIYKRGTTHIIRSTRIS